MLVWYFFFLYFSTVRYVIFFLLLALLLFFLSFFMFLLYLSIYWLIYLFLYVIIYCLGAGVVFPLSEEQCDYSKRRCIHTWEIEEGDWTTLGTEGTFAPVHTHLNSVCVPLDQGNCSEALSGKPSACGIFFSWFHVHVSSFRYALFFHVTMLLIEYPDSSLWLIWIGQRLMCIAASVGLLCVAKLREGQFHNV